MSRNIIPASIPRIIVTGRGSVTDRVVGLEIGADDYIVKPFEPRELVARLRAVLRRASLAREGNPLDAKMAAQFGNWTADLGACTVTHCDGRVLELSAAETSLLGAFLRSPGRIMDRSSLLDATGSRNSEPFDRSMDARISRLRRKLEAGDGDSELIRTIYGAGYIFTQEVVWSR